MSTIRKTAADLAEFVGGELKGDGSLSIEGVADVRFAAASEIAFIRDASFAPLAEDSAAGAIFVTEWLDIATTQILIEDAHAAFAQVALLFHPVPRATEHEIHPTAVVHDSAQLSPPVLVGPHVHIGAGAKIGSNTSIQAGTVIGEDVEIGNDCTIYPRVVIYPKVQIGDEVILHSGVVLGTDGFGYVETKEGHRLKFPQLGGLLIGDRVEIGANSTVDRGALVATVIGSGTKIDNLCHIAHNCKIGEDCGISALSGLAGGGKLGDRVVLGGHVTSNTNVRIVDDVIIGGNSGITGDVDEPGMYQGLPLVPIARGRRNLILLKRLPEIASEVKDLRRDLNEMMESGDGPRSAAVPNSSDA